DVKQTRCTTCDAEHEYKHAKVPRQRRKSETPAALYAQVATGAPKRVSHEATSANGSTQAEVTAVPHEEPVEAPAIEEPAPVSSAPPVEEDTAGAAAVHDVVDAEGDEHDEDPERAEEDGPIHRRLIRASLPRPEGQQPPARPIPEFTIRQPGGRPSRFRPRHQRAAGGGQFGGNRSNGNVHGGPQRVRQGSGRPPHGATSRRRHNQGGGRKRLK